MNSTQYFKVGKSNDSHIIKNPKPKLYESKVHSSLRFNHKHASAGNSTGDLQRSKSKV
jgi:hypothetical protein